MSSLLFDYNVVLDRTVKTLWKSHVSNWNFFTKVLTKIRIHTHILGPDWDDGAIAEIMILILKLIVINKINTWVKNMNMPTDQLYIVVKRLSFYQNYYWFKSFNFITTIHTSGRFKWVLKVDNIFIFFLYLPT